MALQYTIGKGKTEIKPWNPHQIFVRVINPSDARVQVFLGELPQVVATVEKGWNYQDFINPIPTFEVRSNLEDTIIEVV